MIAALVAFIGELFVARDQKIIRKLEIFEQQHQQNLEEIEQLKGRIKEMNEMLETSGKDTNNSDVEQQTAVEITEVCQEIYEDLESEELNAGSNMITTTAEVHFQDNNQAASNQPQSCVLEEVEIFTLIE